MAEKVYFIQAPSGLIKIGRSTDVPRRKKALQTAHGERLKLLGTIPGGVALEREFHDRWESLRQSGEWFRPTPEFLADIKRALDAPQFDLGQAKHRLNSRTSPERDRLAKNLIAYFKDRHPSNTAAGVARDTGIPESTVKKWMDRTSAPSAMFFEPLLHAYGPTFLAAMWPASDLPDWLREAIAIEQAEALMGRIQADMAGLRAALGVAREGGIERSLAEFVRNSALPVSADAERT